MTSKHSSPRARFGVRFSLLARRWRRALDERLAESGLSDATWAPLVHLQETGGGITQKELAALVGIDGSSLVRLLDILCRQGLVERRVDENDSRARLIYLTESGEVRVAAIRRELVKGEEEMLANISDDDLAIMLQHFDRIDERLSAIQARRREEKSR
ncbi:MarR family winged helix-turn-helix transcriptional regulator [Agrobacterium tumefaciens]|uniref:MarR family winged helix-turn-helix transcriptional regulator n=1 Tax=Agrobacterium tumefaciens TaxID=358 RepID=UPI0021CE519F|nr:MarR family transcriptional regulator [Agrobacterium tumefaciens]UXS04227.1 MarR family transcriptional regulator [Agrobacterium tumefaciens]